MARSHRHSVCVCEREPTNKVLGYHGAYVVDFPQLDVRAQELEEHGTTEVVLAAERVIHRREQQVPEKRGGGSEKQRG